MSALTARNSPFQPALDSQAPPPLFSNLSEVGDYLMTKSSKDPKPGSRSFRKFLHLFNPGDDVVLLVLSVSVDFVSPIGL